MERYQCVYNLCAIFFLSTYMLLVPRLVCGRSREYADKATNKSRRPRIFDRVFTIMITKILKKIKIDILNLYSVYVQIKKVGL